MRRDCAKLGITVGGVRWRRDCKKRTVRFLHIEHGAGRHPFALGDLPHWLAARPLAAEGSDRARSRRWATRDTANSEDFRIGILGSRPARKPGALGEAGRLAVPPARRHAPRRRALHASGGGRPQRAPGETRQATRACRAGKRHVAAGACLRPLPRADGKALRRGADAAVGHSGLRPAHRPRLATLPCLRRPEVVHGGCTGAKRCIPSRLVPPVCPRRREVVPTLGFEPRAY